MTSVKGGQVVNSELNAMPSSRHKRKISPASPGGTDPTAIGSNPALQPGEPALGEWRELGLELPDIDSVRRYRLERIRDQLRRRDLTGILVADPINIRYATDCTNMQVWCTHNAVRYAFVATEGPVVLFDFHGCAHLSDSIDTIDETRPAKAWFYFGVGDRTEEMAAKWAREISDLVMAYGGGNRRIAIDRCNPEGLHALNGLGIDLFNGEEIMELARAIKSDEEIKAMRCALATCEKAMAIMEDHLQPGVTEQRLWSYLHAENIARGGEWIETRLLASGPRTNPWFAECSARAVEEGDLLAFDTDLIGPYGMCADISRTWLCGGGRASNEQHDLFALAREQIAYNTELLRPGTGFRELTEKAFRLPGSFAANRYSVVFHGVGLCDEYPAIYYPEDWEAAGYDGELEENMVLCVESYVGREGGKEGVKLEEQVLITADGPVTLSTYPFDSRLSV